MKEERLHRGLLVALAAPALPMAALTLPLVTFVPEHYGNALAMDLATVGLVFMVVRLADIGLDPIIGGLMDATRTRWSRFRPWLVGGVPVVLAGTALLFLANPGVGPLYLLAALLITYASYSVLQWPRRVRWRDRRLHRRQIAVRRRRIFDHARLSSDCAAPCCSP